MIVLDQLTNALGDAVITNTAETAAFRRDYWVRSEIDEWTGNPSPAPLAVVAPSSTEDVALAVKICRAAGVSVVTRGAGSGVVGGVLAQGDSVVLSTHRLSNVRSIDAENLLATFGSGTNGLEAEEFVAAQGLTIGHWPQSIAVSSVGGWLATRASGQFSTAYGNIEDIVYSFVAVLPDSSIYRSRETPRAAAGPDLRHILIGSEGTLGIITEVTFSLRFKPATNRKQAFHFEAFSDGLQAIRSTMTTGWRPPVVRLYDPRETRRNFGDVVPKGNSILIFLHEGPPGLPELESAAVAEICTDKGGVLADSMAVEKWFEHRNEVPTWTELFEKGLLVDTIEIATDWTRLAPLYEAVSERVGSLESVISMTAHSSHAYRSGANLYFTAVASPGSAAEFTSVYDEIWTTTMRTASALGAGLAHHHGIGRVRRDWLREELGEAGTDLLRSVKQILDPDNLFNPGVLIPQPSSIDGTPGA